MLRPSKVKIWLNHFLQLICIWMLLEQLYYLSLPHSQTYEWQKVIEKWDYVIFIITALMIVSLIFAKNPLKKELPSDIYTRKK